MFILWLAVEMLLIGGYAASRSQRVRLAVAHVVHDEAQAKWREFKRKHPKAARRMRAMRRGWRREPVGGTRRPPGRPPRRNQPHPPRRNARQQPPPRRDVAPRGQWTRPRPEPEPLPGPSPEQILGPQPAVDPQQAIEMRSPPLPETPASPTSALGMSGADAVNIDAARSALDELSGVGLASVDQASSARASAEGAVTNVDALAGQLASMNLDSETLGQVAGITESATALQEAASAFFAAAEALTGAARAAREGLDARHSVMEEAVAATPEPAEIDFYRK